MPSTIRLANGRVTATPGVYVSVDASSLAGTNPDATGIVALIGEAIGGAPYTAYASGEDLPAFASAPGLARAYPAGDLLEAANFAFAPSGVTGGAQTIIPVKANPATQAKVTLNGATAAALTLKAQAWGMAGNDISVAVAAGTSSGVKLTIVQGSTTEVGDNLGDDPVGKLSYSPDGSWAHLFATKDGSGLTLDGTATAKAIPGDLTATSLASPAPVTITADQGDAGKTLTIVGLSAQGAALVEKIVLTGGAQSSSGTFASILAASLSDAAQSVAFEDGSGNALGTIATNDTSIGIAPLPALAVANGTVGVTSSKAGEKIVLVGKDSVGAQVADVVTTQAGTAVQSAKAFSILSLAAVGGLRADATIAGKVAVVPSAGGATLQQAKGALSGVKGLQLGVTKGDETTPVAGLDSLPRTELTGNAITLLSDIEAVVDWVNANSQLVFAEVAPGAKEQPAPTPQPVFLSGGNESPATYQDYVAALALLKRRRVNLVVACSCDPAVSKAVEAHCALMAGIGQSERSGFVGAQDSTLTKPASMAQAIAQAAQLNSAYVSLVPNGCVRYDTTGNLVTYAPWMTAVGLAGMRAGARVNTPLTRKSIDVVALTQDPGYDPIDDSDTLLTGGVAFLCRQDGIGFALKRDITTWTRDPNPVFSSGMVAFATGANVYFYRLALQQFVGQDGFVGSPNHVITEAESILSQLKRDQRIFDYTPPTVVRDGDVLLVDQSWQYDPETNFILATIRINNPTAAAA